jgi:hypothetical protein
MKIRALLPPAFLLAVLAAGGVFAWLSHHPEAKLWRDLEGWPIVGDAFARLHRSYLPPPAPVPTPTPEDEYVVEYVFLGSRPEKSSTRPELEIFDASPAPPPFAGPPEYIWLLAGARLLDAPAPGAHVREQVEAITRLPKLERRGDWFRVWRFGREAWVLLPGYREDGSPPYGDAADPPRPLLDRPPEKKQLVELESLLGRRPAQGLGGYRLLTDVEDRALLETLDKLVMSLEGEYRERYGREPLGQARAAIALFRFEGAYRIFQLRSRDLLGLNPAGHTAHGVAALFLGERPLWDVGATLVHELTHLLNRRALGPALPPWLDEGLAEDFSFLARDSTGRVELGRLVGALEVTGTRRQISGALASLHGLRVDLRADDLPGLRQVLELEWRAFVHQDARRNYDVAGFFVRFLAQGQEGRWRDGFRSFLGHVADGAAPDLALLEKALGQKLEVIEAEFRSWLLVEAATRLGPLHASDSR